MGIVAVNNPGYVEAAFDVFEAGGVVVPLRSADDTARIQAANVQRVLTPAERGPWMQRRYVSPDRDEVGLISFTSGTTGQPKGVMATHRTMGDAIRRLNETMAVDSSIREYVGAVPYFAFGFGRCRAVSAAGGSFYLPPGGFNPAEVAAMLKRGEINAISTVPSLWRVLLQNSDLIGKHGRQVRWIEVGSQYMSRAEKEALRDLFPQARIVTMYGLTEASRVTFLEVHREQGEVLESVGKTTGDMQVRILPNARVAIRGPSVASAYLIGGQEQALTDEDGWYVTNDYGSIRDGFLYYEGRADDVINCGGIKVDPEALESRICAELACDGTGLAVCAKADALRGEGFLVAITPEAQLDPQQVKMAAVQATQALGVNAPDAIEVLEVPVFPRTDSGKVQRKKLSQAHAAQAAPSAPATAPAEKPRSVSAEHTVRDVFCRVLKLPEVRGSDSFVTLNGDSLSYVQLAMQLERRLGSLPLQWERLSIEQLERLQPATAQRTQLDTGTFLRAVAICNIVVFHSSFTPQLTGAVNLLLMISGLNLARFQFDALLQGRWLQPVVSLLKNLLLPYWILSAAYQWWKHDFSLPVLLLFGNFVSTDVQEIFPTWFVDVLVQIVLLFSVLFVSSSVRRFARAAPWRFSAMLSLATLVLGLALTHLWPVEHLYNRVPQSLFWVFAMGWVIHFAASRAERLLSTAALLIALPLMLMTGLVHVQVTWVVAGGLALLWIPEVALPRAVKSVVQVVGAAAFYIYLTHMAFMDLMGRVAHVHNPLLLALGGIAGGIVAWLGAERLRQMGAGRTQHAQRA